MYTPQTVTSAKTNKTVLLPLSERAIRQIITNNMISTMIQLVLYTIRMCLSFLIGTLLRKCDWRLHNDRNIDWN